MGELKLIPREAGKAYVDNMLWLPRSGVRERAVKDALQIAVPDEKGGMTMVQLWDETQNHIIAPREFVHPSTYGQYPFPFVDLTPKIFPRSGIGSKLKGWRDAKQQEAYEAFSKAPGGILNLATGKGKTVLALQRAADLGCPALIVVPTTYLFTQWQEQIAKHIELPIGQSVGIMQGAEMDWQRPITIAMIHTLANRAKSGELPEGFSEWFGVVFFDEVHHLAAEHFVNAAPTVHGVRYGLTATAQRQDGLHFVYNYHLGGVFYHDLTTDLVPLVYFQVTPSTVDQNDPEILDVRGEINIPKLRSYLGKQSDILDFRAKCIQEAVNGGRKILAVSHSKQMLLSLNERFPGSGLIVQETPQDERTAIVRRSQVTFSIMRLGTEGLDDENLDTLFALTPFSSPNELQQLLGRILRTCEGKRQPVAVIFDDAKIKQLAGMCWALRKVMNGWNLKWSTIKPP